jgi:chromosome segregation protein
LYLKRLEIVGFKSFATRTVAELEPGIVVVVGPNGSGKSNIADGVRWVLGEQSAKAVRARRPEELVFAGSAQRNPLGMAEVSLVLDNADGALPVEYAEVRVTRRLYRSGEGEYLLNGARVRLRDITQLLLQVGLGADGYGVIGQGAVDELILQRPDERRVVFENAADIRRHQLRLQETRSRLAATEANLARVQDVIAELAPHVRRLKVQADRARRSDSARAELHQLQLAFFRARLRQARRERAEAEQVLAAAVGELRAAEAATARLQAEAQAADQARAELEARLATLRPRTEAYREQARTAERALAVARERAEAIAAQRALLAATSERVAERLEALRQEVSAPVAAEGRVRTAAETPEESSAIAGVRARLQELTAALAAAGQALDAARGQREAADRQVLRLEEQLASGEERRRAGEADRAVEEARQADRRARIETLSDALARLRNELGVAQQELEAAQRASGGAVDERRQAGQRVEQAREAARVAARRADRLYGALDALGVPARPPGGAGDPTGSPGRAEDAPAPTRAAPGPPNQGGVSLPPDWQPILHGLPVVGVAAELAARVRPVDRLLRGYLMRTVVLADDAAAREAHRRLAARLGPAAPAWAVISASGLLLTPLGERTIESGSTDAGAAVADWRKQVQRLQAERAEAEAVRARAERVLAEQMAAFERAEAAERAARGAVREHEARAQELRRLEAQAGAELAQQRQAFDRAARDAEQHESARRARVEEERRAREQLAAARTERSAAAAALRDHEQQVAALGGELDALRERLAALEAERARRAAEIEARASLVARLQAELAAAETERRAADDRARQLAAQAEELAAREMQLREEASGARAELATLEAELAQAEADSRRWSGGRRALDEDLAAARAAERAAHDQHAQALVRLQRSRDELERLEREMTDAGELEADLPGGGEWARQLRLELSEPSDEPRPGDQHAAGDERRLGPPGAEPEPDLEALRRRIAVLQRELRAVGTVAASVLDEYHELADRQAFLEQQSEDLTGAMAELRQAARDLERTLSDRFARVFDATNAAFQECFRQLFGGGEARLVLTDPDDLLRTGVDIVARPPEKKLQGLLSLSGGERTLTIVALLFGLLKVNPTPFCVLDEVDAALDEANVQRFADLLGRFARHIQFVVVTHNRATMEEADAMYGVTMDANGVSRLYSVQPRRLAAGR